MKKIVTLALLLVSVIACKEKKDSNSNIENSKDEVSVTEEAKKDTPSGSSDAVCILDRLSIRKTPGKKGKWVASMSVGEKISFMGEKVIDSITKKEYSKVKLIDGKEGWTRSSFIVVGGKVGVLLEEASVYKRPDLLTKTTKKYSPMDIIAIMSTQADEWIQVKGKRAEGEYVEEAWIKPSNISQDAVDVATAKFATQALSKGNMESQIKSLQDLVGNTDLSQSKFIPLLKEKIVSLEEKNKASQAIIESEE